jgi:hypothetical protein
VVNFVLDKKFNAVRRPISPAFHLWRRHGRQYNLGGGRRCKSWALFNGRGYFSEAAPEYRHRDPVNQSARPYGPPAKHGALAGTGTAANPFNTITNGRRPKQRPCFGGVVQGCVPSRPRRPHSNASGRQWRAGSPFKPGAPPPPPCQRQSDRFGAPAM